MDVPIEYYMEVLKWFVKNKYHSKVCIVQRYITKTSEFLSEYMSKTNPMKLHDKSWHT